MEFSQRFTERRATPSRDESPKRHTGAVSFCGLIDLWARARCRSLMKNFDSGDRINFFTGRAPDVFAVRVRVGRIAGVHRIVKQPAGNNHAPV